MVLADFLILGAVLFGLSNAALHTNIAFMWPRFFGRRHLGSIQGAAQMIGIVGASIGPLPMGIAFDLYGSYTGVLYLLAVLPVVIAIMLAFLRPPSLEHASD